MRKVSAAYLASLIHYPHEDSFSHIHIDHITIDSRKVHSSSLFVALRGEHVDGHDYIEEAIRMGAELIIASLEKKTESITHNLALSH